MKFFDSYAYMGLVAKDNIERLRIIQEAKRAGVRKILTVANNLNDFQTLYSSVRELSDMLYFAAGLAPTEVGTNLPGWERQLENLLNNDNVIAAGPIGLDYQKGTTNRKAQIELFVKQLDIARRLHKPAIIYNRMAGEDIQTILAESAPKEGIIFHCYSENDEYAFQLLNNNNFPVYFSFAGNLTFRNSRELHKTILNLPTDHLLVETASPFLTPSLFTGTRNVPANIFTTVEFMSELLDMDFEKLAIVLYENSLRAFHIQGA